MSARAPSMKKELESIRAWAKAKIADDTELPWSWYQYMKLIETADAILAGMATKTTENSPQPDERLETHLRLVDSTDPQDNSQHHPYGPTVPLPM